jgi:dsRNA-specific ribonuclease
MSAKKILEQQRTNAWVGDAVLALYAREWILQQSDVAPAQRAEAFTQITSNQFLASFGEPTAVEASIGEIYQAKGLQAAFDWIETHCIPLYLKQRRNRRKTVGSHRSKAK